MKEKTTVKKLAVAGVISALYCAMTLLTWNIAGGAIQCRLSEALCILPVFSVSGIYGVTLGCFLSNLLGGAVWQDVVFGTIATLLGAVGARMLKKHPYFAPIPTVLANTVIVPFVLAYGYNASEGLPFLFVSIFLGEAISAYFLGILLYQSVRKTKLDRKL